MTKPKQRYVRRTPPRRRTITMLPRSLRVSVGNLEIVADQGQRRPLIGSDVRITLNGKPISVRGIVLTIASDEVVSATVEFLPHEQQSPDVAQFASECAQSAAQSGGGVQNFTGAG